MNDEYFKQYLKERYADQIKWYSDRATRHKRFYIVFQWGVIVFSAIVPVLVVTVPEKHKIITAIISIILAIGTAVLKTFKYQELWINYRTISETLKKEKYFYEAGLDDYGISSAPKTLFIERVEALISRENSLWVTTHMQNETESGKKQKK